VGTEVDVAQHRPTSARRNVHEHAAYWRRPGIWQAPATQRNRPRLIDPRNSGAKEALMPKPIMNLDEVAFDDGEENGPYTCGRGQDGRPTGARQLGYNLTVLPPGKVQCPFHSHRGEEEMFLILEGEGELRFGDQRYPIRKHDVIACPTGGPEVAHQIINTGQTPMRYLSLSTLAEVDACEYPDSQKVGIYTGRNPDSGLRKMFRAETTVDYYDRERF